ncbi:MAG TPA: Xaa-Pro peptidase family protein [Thermoleophilaceae bacterium]|nr:Xaa-Pro peptidase family protein [Thermoleophilaceae bacterium]
MTRADRLEELLRERELDSIVVTNLVNVRYLTGFTGTNGVAVLGGGRRVFLTDFRYMTQAARQVDGFDVQQGRQDLLEDAAAHAGGRIGFEDYTMTVRAHSRLGGFVADGAELVPAGRIVERLRAVKEPAELDAIRAAAALADEVLGAVPERGLAGRTEHEVAFEIETELRRRGAEPSFPSIVAGGANGALPHHAPGDDEIARDTLVVVDMGAQLDGYCSDCTRTFATGELGDDAAAVYDLVLGTQVATLERVRVGEACVEVDAFARERIADAGHGERFGHGLGHGVGLEVHEPPTLSRAGEGELRAGNVVTVEPGVYVPEEFGVRIEDLVVVTDDGPEILSSVPKELTRTS